VLPGYFSRRIPRLPIRAAANWTVHVLKDITDRKRAEEKYRTLVSNVQEGCFYFDPAGPIFLILTTRSAHLWLPYPRIASRPRYPSLYVNPQDRERLKKLLDDHGAVADFEFELRTSDGEIRSVTESSIAVREASGVVTAYQGFLLDITERKRAEHEFAAATGNFWF